jgi:hypothetical protein
MRIRFGATTALGLALTFTSVVQPAAAVGPAIDMFHCMPATPTPGERKFVVEPALPLVDLETVSVDATKSRDVCAPAAATAAQIVNSEINLDRYVIKAAKGEPKHVKQLGIPLVNALGTVTLDTKARELLALPSKTSAVQLPVAPDFASHEVDRFDCYKAKISKGAPKLPKDLELTIADERTNPPRRYAVKKVTSLCVPTAVLGTPAKHIDHLVCYQVKATKGVCAAGAPFAAGRGCKKEEDCGGVKGPTTFCTLQAKKLPQTLGLFTSDLIRGLQQDLVKDGDVCVPSTVVH